MSDIDSIKHKEAKLHSSPSVNRISRFIAQVQLFNRKSRDLTFTTGSGDFSEA